MPESKKDGHNVHPDEDTGQYFMFCPETGSRYEIRGKNMFVTCQGCGELFQVKWETEKTA